MKIKNKKLKFRHLVFDIFRNSIFNIQYSRSAGGFALVELLIAMALLGIAASSALLFFGALSDRLFTKNLAYAIALSFRQAQSYGVSVRGTDAEEFGAGYGIHFDAQDKNDKVFLLFADKNKDKQFNGVFGAQYNERGCLAGDECLEVFRVERGSRIEKFCGVLSEDKGRDAPEAQKQEECNNSSTPPSSSNKDISSLDVLFLRPNPDAIIRTNRSPSAQYKAARAYVISPRGERGVVEAANTGQISVK